MALAIIATTAQAATITSATAVVSNTAGTFSTDNDFIYAINQEGLNTTYTSDVTDFDAYVASNPLHTEASFLTEWFAALGRVSGTVVLDLGQEYIVSGAALWNEEANGLAQITYSTSLNNVTYTAGGTFNPTDNTNGLAYGPDSHLFYARTARYVKLDLVATSLTPMAIGEIAFRTDPVPEPATLTILAFATLTALTRKKKS